MPTITHLAIGSYTISGTSTNSVTFNAISGYTDLVLIVSGKTTHTTGDGMFLRFNNDSSGNYSRTYGYSTGTGHGQGKQSSQTGINVTMMHNTTTHSVFHINGYSGSTYKNVLVRNDSQTNAMVFTTGTWINTAAITSVTAAMDLANFTAGSTITLYGIL
jgi:hypothetical protein